jgi:tetratricopeptide (TPR) repeat protein
MLLIARERGDEPERERCIAALAQQLDARKDRPLAREWAMRLNHDDRPDEASGFLTRFTPPDARDSSMNAWRTRRELAFVRAEAFLRAGKLDLAKEQADQARELSDAVSLRTEFEPQFLEARIELAANNPQQAIARRADPTLLGRASPSESGAAHTLLGEALLAQGKPREAIVELKLALERSDARRARELSETQLSKEEARRINLIGEWEGAGLETVALLARAHLQLGG